MAQVAIEQLQQELSASRKEEEVFKDEARKVQLCAWPFLALVLPQVLTADCDQSAHASPSCLHSAVTSQLAQLYTCDAKSACMPSLAHPCNSCMPQ